MCLSLDFDPHDLVQRHHLHQRQERPMILTSLVQVADNGLGDIRNWHRNVETRLVDLIPTVSACLPKCVFNIIERLIDLFANIFGILFGEAVPAACRC